MNFIKLPHSIYSKDENGKILAEITFPEIQQGFYNIQETYLSESYYSQELAQELIKMAIATIEEAGGKFTSTNPYVSGWIERFYKREGYVKL